MPAQTKRYLLDEETQRQLAWLARALHTSEAEALRRAVGELYEQTRREAVKLECRTRLDGGMEFLWKGKPIVKVGPGTAADFRKSATLQSQLQTGELGAEFIFVQALLMSVRHREGLVWYDQNEDLVSRALEEGDLPLEAFRIPQAKEPPKSTAA